MLGQTGMPVEGPVPLAAEAPIETRTAGDFLRDVTTAAVDQRERLREAIRELPDQQREILVRARYQHRTAGQIADDLQLPIETVYAQLRVGLHALHALLVV